MPRKSLTRPHRLSGAVAARRRSFPPMEVNRERAGPNTPDANRDPEVPVHTASRPRPGRDGVHRCEQCGEIGNPRRAVPRADAALGKDGKPTISSCTPSRTQWSATWTGTACPSSMSRTTATRRCSPRWLGHLVFFGLPYSMETPLETGTRSSSASVDLTKPNWSGGACHTPSATLKRNRWLADEELIERLGGKKTGCAAKLAERFRAKPDMALRGPEAFRAWIGRLVALNRKSVFDEVDS